MLVRCVSRGAIVVGALFAVVNACAAGRSVRRPITELSSLATVKLGKTADWVAVTADAVWVGGTGPNAVHKIDPATNRRVATVLLPGNPCAGLAVGFGSLWVPLCGKRNSLARVDLEKHAVTLLSGLGPAMREGGIATSTDSVWLIVRRSSLARIDPASGGVRQLIHVPAGSYNPLFSGGKIWLTRAAGAELTVFDAASGARIAVAKTGPHPRDLDPESGRRVADPYRCPNRTCNRDDPVGNTWPRRRPGLWGRYGVGDHAGGAALSGRRERRCVALPVDRSGR